MLKVLTEGCEPKRATKFSAAIDLFAAEDVVIGTGETAKIPLGIAIDINSLRVNKDSFGEAIMMEVFMSKHYLQVSPRSSLGLKGLIIPNGIGIIDLDYKGEICLILHRPFTLKTVWEIVNKAFIRFRGGDIEKYEFDRGHVIQKGDKIAQIMLCEHKSYLMGYDSEEERVGGFGSSGN